jgi:serine/threonine-protein kinase RsbW
VSEPASVEVAFPARAEYLILGRLALAGLARVLPIDDETLADLKLAVTEACGNVVRHAYPDASGEVRLELVFNDGLLRITVEDDGVGMSGSVAENDPGREELAESGMGLALIRSISDTVQLGRAADGGTRLVLTKSI